MYACVQTELISLYVFYVDKLREVIYSSGGHLDDSFTILVDVIILGV